eukprot:NODE_423_length_8874_cov_0.432023.p5 type:complete len:169 gc:universal NODE_423_length_8874_cov_0.432023:7818-7312(-)
MPVISFPHREQHPLALVSIVIFLSAGIQFFIYYMKKNHEREFNFVSTVLLMLFPLYFAYQLRFTRFITIWIIFVTYNVIVYTLIKKRFYFTPRLVFKLAMREYQLCYALGVCGYVLFFISLFVPMMAKLTIDLSIHLLFYGLYFGTFCLHRSSLQRHFLTYAAIYSFY